MHALSWPDVLKACIGKPKKVTVALVVVALVLSVSLVARWVHERGPGLSGPPVIANNNADAARGIPEIRIAVRAIPGPDTHSALQESQDCAAWAAMSVKEKKKAYRTDPRRWDVCVCEAEGCLVDSYVTGKLVR